MISKLGKKSTATHRVPASDGDAVVHAVVDGLGDVVEQSLLLSLEAPFVSLVFLLTLL